LFRECNNYLEGEKKEMIDLYQKKGLSFEESTQLVEIMSKHQSIFVDFMMVEELGILPPDEQESPLKKGMVTFFSFLFFGCLPLMAYVVEIAVYGSSKIASPDRTFGIACGLTGFTMFILGASTSKFTSESWLKSGAVMLLNGTVAAVSAFGIGELLSFLI